MSSTKSSVPTSVCVHPSKLEQVNRVLVRQGFDTKANFARDTLEIHPDTLRKFEQGKKVSRRTFQDICAALELDWCEMAYVKEEPAVEESASSESLAVVIEDPETNVEMEAEPEADVIDVELEETAPEAQSEPADESQSSSGQPISQTIHGANHGIMIGNVQGTVNLPSSNPPS